jgi:hypothetical protein
MSSQSTFWRRWRESTAKYPETDAIPFRERGADSCVAAAAIKLCDHGSRLLASLGLGVATRGHV